MINQPGLQLVETTVMEGNQATVTHYYINQAGFYLVERYINYQHVSAYNKGKLRGLNERRDSRHISELPESPVRVHESDCSLNNFMKCPYCGFEDHNMDGLSIDDYGDWVCDECGETYVYSIEWLSGITTKPKPCKAHRFVFSSQYYYGPETIHNTEPFYQNMKRERAGSEHNARILHCLYCGAMDYEKLPWNMLPWLDEYNDPDFFDPGRILAPPASFDRDKPTPVLDLLSDRWRLFKSAYVEKALAEHTKHYSQNNT